MLGKITAIIQARMGSTRLPGKVMFDLCGKPVLGHVLERVQQARLIDDIVVAPSTAPADDVIEDYLHHLGVKCFRGQEQDVLSRYYDAANTYPAETIVRITADCPLIDPHIIDKVTSGFLHNPVEYAANIGGGCQYPRGVDCEVFSYRLLARAFREASETYEHEHVTPFMYWKQDKILWIINEEDYSDMRWTLDTMEDWQLIREVYRHFYRGRHDFYLQDIYLFLLHNPDIYQMNHHVQQKPVK